MYMFEDEVVENRLGEALEAELSKSGIKEKQKEISCIITRLCSNMTKEEMEIFDEAEEKILQYISFYGETAYRLGAMDGIKYGIEQKAAQYHIRHAESRGGGHWLPGKGYSPGRYHFTAFIQHRTQ